MSAAEIKSRTVQLFAGTINTKKIDEINSLAHKLSLQKPQTTVELNRRAIVLTREHDYSRGYAGALLTAGWCGILTGDWSATECCLARSQTIFALHKQEKSLCVSSHADCDDEK